MTRPGTATAAYLRAAYRARLRPPTGGLRFPFVDPGAGYEDILWDWDAYFCCVGLESLAVSDSAIGVHARGCVENFLQRQGPDGHAPYSITPQTPERTTTLREPSSPRNSCKPLLTQFALLAESYGGGDVAWLGAIAPSLERSVEHWFATQSSALGLLTWRSHRGSGADNHPAYFQRPHNSVADPFLNALMVLECRALAHLAERTGCANAAAWAGRADRLAAAIERWLWDPIDGTYYCVDVGRGDPGAVRTPVDWAVPLKFRAWTMVLPLVAGVAAPERAARVVTEHLLRPDQLRSPVGVRSLARVEPSYRVFRDYNPSCWLGPVWVVATYLGWRALRQYGYVMEARQLAVDHLTMLDRDVRAHGCLHEYYDPETGAGLMHPGFVNWNTCALPMTEHVAD